MGERARDHPAPAVADQHIGWADGQRRQQLRRSAAMSGPSAPPVAGVRGPAPVVAHRPGALARTEGPRRPTTRARWPGRSRIRPSGARLPATTASSRAPPMSMLRRGMGCSWTFDRADLRASLGRRGATRVASPRPAGRPTRPAPRRYNRLRCAADFLVFAGGLLFLAGWVSVPRAQSTSPATAAFCNVTTTERVVAIGDVHGAYDQFVAILRAAGLVDARERWSGGRAVLVQTGDVLDRGTDSRKALDLLRRLERDARSAGGQVIALTRQPRVHAAGSATGATSAPANATAFRDARLRTSCARPSISAGSGRREARAARREGAVRRRGVPRGVPPRDAARPDRDAAGVRGRRDYGDWMRARPAVARSTASLFLHGGISDEVASLGCDGDQRRGGQGHEGAAGRPGAGRDAARGQRDGAALVSRAGAGAGGRRLRRSSTSILKRMGARAIVVGHTPALRAHHPALRRPRRADRHGHARRHVLSRRRARRRWRLQRRHR